MGRFESEPLISIEKRENVIITKLRKVFYENLYLKFKQRPILFFYSIGKKKRKRKERKKIIVVLFLTIVKFGNYLFLLIFFFRIFVIFRNANYIPCRDVLFLT